MDHVQLRVDDWTEAPPESGEGRMMTVHVLCSWPSSATEEEIHFSLKTACKNACEAVSRKFREQAA
jgi:hypothetical protein